MAHSIKKVTKVSKNIDSDEDDLIEELEAFSAISNKNFSSKKKKNNKYDSSSDSSDDSSDDDKKKLPKKKVIKKQSDKKPVKKTDKKPINKKQSAAKKVPVKKIAPKINTEDEPDKKKKIVKKKKDSDSDSGSDSDSDAETNIDDTVKNAIIKWVQADNRQRELRKNDGEKKKENNKLNTIKKETSQVITKAMVDENMPKIDITKGKLLLNKTSKAEPISQELIENALTKKYPKKKVDEIINLIENEREEIPRFNIKRVSNTS